ncbi:MAG: HAD family hydrolase [Chitinophagaceae bacterium]|nr:MAG: HAD family hydrolase [Chitinophagaceae bacterium]
MRNKIKVIAFDADDTLWVNEPYFRQAEDEFCVLLENYSPQHSIAKDLFRIELQNLELYGYGIKGFMLSMIEAVSVITGGTAPISLVNRAIEIGKDMLQRPIELLEGIEDTLASLQGRFRLVVATKGDLLDQERKLNKSGLQKYFHHIEIMSDKKVANYQKLLKHLDCAPGEFLMLGNSVKSDVLPVLEIGGYAAHIPYHITWQHEVHEMNVEHENFLALERADQILEHI